MFTQTNPSTTTVGDPTAGQPQIGYPTPMWGFGQSYNSMGFTPTYGFGQPFGTGNTPIQPYPSEPVQPTYAFTPQAFIPQPGLQGLLSNETLYSNPNAPWAVPQSAGQGVTQAPAQTQVSNGGWDSSAFMQGLQSLGYNL